MNNNDDDDKNVAADDSSQHQQLREDGQIDDSVDEAAEVLSPTSSSSVYCDQPPWGAALEWKCTSSTRLAVVLHSSHQQQPPISAGGRRPLLLPPVRWPLVATKRKHARRPFGTKSVGPSLITSFALLALICLSSMLNSFSGLKPSSGQRVGLQNGVGVRRERPSAVDENELGKKHSEFIATKAEAVVAQRMRTLHHLLANLDDVVALTPQSPPRLINILLTEQQRARSRPGTPSPAAMAAAAASPQLLQHQQQNDHHSPSTATSADAINSNNYHNNQYHHHHHHLLQQHADDPTLMDYDAIDAYWRIDIEQEKNSMVHEYHHQHPPVQHQQQNQPTETEQQLLTEWGDYHRQYERDLQLLTEKSMFCLHQQQPPPSIESAPAVEAVRNSNATNADVVDDDERYRRWSFNKMLPTSSNNDNEDNDDEWLDNFLQEDDGVVDDVVTSSGWAERWWKTVEDFAAVSVAQDEEHEHGNDREEEMKQFSEQQQHHLRHQTKIAAAIDEEKRRHHHQAFDDLQQQEDMELYQSGMLQSPSSSVDSLMKQEESNNNMADYNLLPPCSPFFSNFVASPFCHQFEDSVLDYDDEVEETEATTTSATEAILRDMTATIPLIRNLNFAAAAANSEPSLEQQWGHQQNQNSLDVPCSSASAVHFGTPSSSNGSKNWSPFPGSAEHKYTSSVRCSSTTSSGFGSCIGFDDMPPSPSSSSCTLLGDEYDGTNVNTTSILCKNVDDETTNVVTTESVSPSSHSYRMEKLMPLSTGTVPKQKRRKMGQKKTKKLGTMMKKTAKCSKLEYERELEQLQQQQEDEEEELHAVRSISSAGSSGQKPKSKRGRKSKDNSLVNEHGLPYTAELLTAMPYTAYSELMNDFRLSAQQKAMIKKIRRRGRNKLAAQKCRERRLHQPHGDWEEGWPIMEEDEEELLVDDNPIEVEQIEGSSDDIRQGDGLLNPANLSLYPSTSTATAVTARTTTPSAAAAAVVGVVEDDHRRRQEYSEFVHSAIAKRRAIRVQV